MLRNSALEINIIVIGKMQYTIAIVVFVRYVYISNTKYWSVHRLQIGQTGLTEYDALHSIRSLYVM